MKGASPSLSDALRTALPASFKCKARHIRTPAKPCDPLFSPPPGHSTERTRLASHFLTISIDYDSKDEHSTPSSQIQNSDPKEVLSFAVEVLVYSSARLTTLFVSKVDSTAFTSRQTRSPTKTAITTFLKWLADKELEARPKTKLVISLFARAQAQYLFPGSSDDKRKHILDDRQLIKWWARVLDPIIPLESSDRRYQAYVTVPGYAGNELRSFMPPVAAGAASMQMSQPRWVPGHPLLELGRTRGIPEHAPPRCFLPRFPDDPKARFVQDLDEEMGIAENAQVTDSPSKRKSGQWNAIRNLERFWEAMEFRQECSSGRAVGFLWLVISPCQEAEEHEEEDASQHDHSENRKGHASDERSSRQSASSGKRSTLNGLKRKKRPRLTGPIIPRQPRLKGALSSSSDNTRVQDQEDADSGDGVSVSQEGYDSAMQILLNLDFSTLDIAQRSTMKWVSEVINITSLKRDLAVEIAGSVVLPESSSAVRTNGASSVSDIGSLVRKKRKPEDSSQNSHDGGSDPVAIQSTASSTNVNMLGSGLIRKKPKT